MLKNEIHSMLSSLMNNKKDFKKFYKTGYFPYSKDESFKGAVAIVNGKAILSFLQDANDENNVIATTIFQDNTTIIAQLMGMHYCRTHFKFKSHKHVSSLESVMSDISTIRKYCAEAEEKSKTSKVHSIRRIFSKSSQSSSKKMSKQDVRTLLETTLDRLNESQTLDNRNSVSPKVDVTNTTPNSTSKVTHTINDQIQEI